MVFNRTRRKKAVSDGRGSMVTVRRQSTYIERVRLGQLSEWGLNESINLPRVRAVGPILK